MSFLSQPISIIPIKPLRKIGNIDLKVVMTESTNDTLTITKQPVQQGASITDHAYKEPTTMVMTALLKENLGLSLTKIYQNLLELQSSRVPFDVITPKRIYKSMLLAVITQVTDQKTEYCLSVTFSLQEIVIVKVSTTQVPRRQQKKAAVTGKTENAGKKSFLFLSSEAISGKVP